MNDSSQKKEKSGVARLLEMAQEQRPLLIVAVIFSVISTLLQFSPFVAVYVIVAELLENVATPAQMDYDLIRRWGIYALLFLVGALVSLYIGNMCSHIAAFRILYNLRVRLSQHLARLPLGFFNRQSTGAIKKNLELSVEKIENFIAHQIPDLVGAIVLPVLMLGVMFWLNWRLALAGSIPIVIAYFFQGWVYLSEKGKREMKAYLDAQERMNAEAVEYVRGMPAVKVFGLTVRNFLRFSDSINAYRDIALRITRQYKVPYSTFFVILTSLLAFMVPVAILLVSGQPSNQALALTVMVFLVMAPGLSVPVLKLLYLGGNLRQITEGTNRIDEIFAQEPVPEPAAPKSPRGYDVTFENVSFSYDDKDAATRTEALTDVSLTAHEGQITALVGPSGSGKSTIANLIPRFWDVSAGSLKIGGVDVREMGTEQLMNTVSFVFQDVHLFYDTIEENIRMGNREASQEEVIAAAKAACCHEFIIQLPEGYQTRIGEGGTYLSGGEAQRVAVARAVLKNAPILVLDEATAFADPENEVKIQQGLISLIQGKTVIVIAHRLSTIREADSILVVDNGHIVETGSHEELLAGEGLYARMWEAHIEAGAWELASDEAREGLTVQSL
jgi:ATP-binding cassette subfamily B protein IrtA